MEISPTQLTTASILEGAEFCCLPVAGGDPVFGLSRRWWYRAEQMGLIKLVRVRRPGRRLGRVLLPIPQALACVQRLSGLTNGT
jgi:hypothetical protein